MISAIVQGSANPLAEPSFTSRASTALRCSRVRLSHIFISSLVGKTVEENFTLEQRKAVETRDVKEGSASGLAELDDEFWQNAEWVEADKTLPLTIRVKESVLDYFKAGGKGYQTRINAVLESYVRAKTGSDPSQPSR